MPTKSTFILKWFIWFFNDKNTEEIALCLKMDNIEEDRCLSEDHDTYKFKILGEPEFVTKKTLPFAPSWTENATTFSPKIVTNNSEKLCLLPGIKKDFYNSLKKKLNCWFPVQKAVLPILLRTETLLPPQDIAISAPTGSGKTLCYIIPILNRFYFCSDRPTDHVLAVILAPTRILIQQISEEFKRFNTCGARILTLNSTMSYEEERKALFPNFCKVAQADIIFSSPQRLAEHLTDPGGRLELSHLRYLVVDEADALRFVREEWLNLVEKCANLAYNKNTSMQKILVSATLSLEADKLHTWNLRYPRLFRTSSKDVVEQSVDSLNDFPETNNTIQTSVNDESTCMETTEKDVIKNCKPEFTKKLVLPVGLKHEVKICKHPTKPLFVYSYLLKRPEWRRAFVFVNKVQDSKRLCILLTYLCGKKRYICEISSNLFGKRRAKIFKRLAKLEEFVVICSDTMGRGIDVKDVDVVFNYNIPQNGSTFIHRAGRTARAGNIGHVVSLVTKEEKLLLKKDLFAIGVWDEAVENRDNDEDFVNKQCERYQKALISLKNDLENAAEKKQISKKKPIVRKNLK